MAFENSQPSAELAAADEIVAAAQNPPQRLPSSDILEDLRDQDRCIKTPEEYVAALEAREARCVDPDLVGRTSSGRDVNSAALNTSFKLAYFWVGSDALEKYLRIGFPETIGGNRDVVNYLIVYKEESLHRCFLHFLTISFKANVQLSVYNIPFSMSHSLFICRFAFYSPKIEFYRIFLAYGYSPVLADRVIL